MPIYNVDLANHPLRAWLEDETFQQWFKDNYPDEQFPPSPNRLGSLWRDYEGAGGKIPSISIKGYDAQNMGKSYRTDKGQANEFNTAWSNAFGGKPPFLANKKSSGFQFEPFGRSPGEILGGVGKAARDVGVAGPLLGGTTGGAGGLVGKGEKMDRFTLLTPMQEQATNKLLSQGMQNMDFGPIEQQARENFQTQTIPSLAERFESMGSGRQRSSAFAPAMTSAGGQLERQLAALKSQYGMHQVGLGLQPRAFENIFRPEQPGVGQQLMSGASLFLPYLLAKGIGI